jgi:hypothetical protein
VAAKTSAVGASSSASANLHAQPHHWLPSCLPLPTRPCRHRFACRTHPPNPSKKKGRRRKGSLEEEIKGEEETMYLPRCTPVGLALVHGCEAAGHDAAEKQRREELRGRRGWIRPGRGHHGRPAHRSGAREWRRMGPTTPLAPSGAARLRLATSMARSREGLASPGGRRRRRRVEPLGYRSAGAAGWVRMKG